MQIPVQYYFAVGMAIPACNTNISSNVAFHEFHQIPVLTFFLSILAKDITAATSKRFPGKGKIAAA